MRAITPFSVAVVLLASGCIPPPEAEMDAATKEAVRSAVEERVLGYFQAMRDSDLEYMLGYYADSDDFVYADFGNPTLGYDDYADFLRGFVESGMSITSLEVDPPHIVVLSSSVASSSFEYSWTMADAEGNSLSAVGAWTYVFKKIDGVWQVVHSTGAHLQPGCGLELNFG